MDDLAPVSLMLPSGHWKQEFEQTRSLILHATEGWVQAVEHVGSTAIAGAIARPTVDTVAGLMDMRGLNEAAGLIEGLNYQRVAVPEWIEELAALLTKPRVGKPTHIVLLVKLRGPTWDRVLRVRDWLATHDADLQRLSNLKLHLFEEHEGDPTRYAAGKHVFFTALEDQLSK